MHLHKECFFNWFPVFTSFIIKEFLMKSILFIAFLAFAAAGAGCHSPEKSTGGDMSSPPPISTDSSGMTTPSNGSGSTTPDTVTTTPVDTTSSAPK